MKSSILAALLALGGSANSSSNNSFSYQASTIIPWTPSNSTSVDQSTIFNGTYFLADRTNRGVHVIDLANNRQTTIIGGFTGLATVNGTANAAKSGPNGLLVLADRNELYASDSGGSIKVIDLVTNSTVANITLDSVERADEMAYDHTTGTVVCTIPNEIPPRLAVISAKYRSITGYITFTNASSLKQPAWNSINKQFYVSVPSTGTNPGGEIAVIDVNALNITNVLPLPQCIPAGIVFGPNQHLFVGCSQDQILTYNISNSLVLDVTTGNVIANISGIAGVGQVAYNHWSGYYFVSAYQNLENGSSTGAPLPQLAIIGANTNVLLQTIPTDNLTAHSVAFDPVTDNVVVPISAEGLVVYSVTNSSVNSTSGSTPSRSSGGSSKIVNNALSYVGLAVFFTIMLF